MSDRVDPLREEGPVYGTKRTALQARCQTLSTTITDLDRQLADIAAQRRRLSRELRQHHRRLWPNLAKRGRQPAPDGTEQLPPIPRDATYLYGRRLRAACLAILTRLGPHPTPLTELHALLHRHHFAIASRHPVKALADALGYETEQGHTQRNGRGLYQPTPTTIEQWSSPTRPLWPGGPPLPPLTPN